MSEPFLGQISLFGFNFAPRGWAMCDGQLMAINQNQALFSLLGTTYGGDGISTFALPDLRGRASVHTDPAHGLGRLDGSESVTLTVQQIPAQHMLQTAATRQGRSRPRPARSGRGTHQAIPSTAQPQESCWRPMPLDRREGAPRMTIWRRFRC